ncbi:MAG: hypothetical protein ACOH15_03605 [Acetobacterium sp.]
MGSFYEPGGFVLFYFIKQDDLGTIIAAGTTGQKSDDDIILFTIGGMPLEDIAWGTTLYRNALEKGIGTKLNLWDDSSLV